MTQQQRLPSAGEVDIHAVHLEGNAAAVERAWRTDSGFSMPGPPEDVWE